MSNTQFLVFEGRNTCLNMDKLSVFRNGIDMPWTYYENDLESDTADISGQKYFMFTSKSAPGPKGEKAGVYVSEIAKYVPYGNGNANTFIKKVIAHPTMDQYKEWGWSFCKDAEGNDILPKFGDFCFKPDAYPDFENQAGGIKPKFEFGFGLNGTCYNFSTEIATVQVYNLSCPPKLFCTLDEQCDIKYDEATKTYNPEFTEAKDGCLECCVQEGVRTGLLSNEKLKGHKAYLLVAVEAGEKVNFEFPDAADTEKSKNDIEYLLDDPTKDKFFNTSTADNQLSIPYRSNVQGPYDKVLGSHMLFDFYRVCIDASENYRNIAYNKTNKLVNRIKLTPHSNNVPLVNFSEVFDITLCLTKEEKVPYITEGGESTYGYKTEAATGFQTSEKATSNQGFNFDFTISDLEALNWARGKDSNLLPAELKDGTLNSAHTAVKRSKLTELEKNVNDYLNNVVSKDLEKYAYFLAIADVISFNPLPVNITDEIKIGLSGENSKCAELRTLLNTRITNTPTLTRHPTIDEIKNDNTMATLFFKAVDVLKADTANADLEGAVWNDIHIKDSSSGTKLDIYLTEDFVEAAISYALWDKHANNVDSYLANMFSGVNIKTSTAPNLLEMMTAASVSWHGMKVQDSRTFTYGLSGESYNRPTGYTLKDIKCLLRPVDGVTALNYICEIKSYTKDNTFPTNIKYGVNNLSLASPLSVTKAMVDTILYSDGNITVTGWTGTSNAGAFVNGKARNDIAANAILGYRNGGTNQFYKTLKSNKLKENEKNLLGKHFFSEIGGNGGVYTGDTWMPKEGVDISGNIYIPDSSEGKYYDVCVDGKPLKETPYDISATYINTTVDIHSVTKHSNYYTDEIKKSRKTDILRESNLKLENLLTCGNIQFLRVGSVIRFFIDKSDADIEVEPLITLPKIEIKLRGDETGKCVAVFDDLCIQLQDCSSTLDMNLDYTRNSVRTGTTYNKVLDDASCVLISQWNNLCIPIDLFGMLEQSETFCLDLSGDTYGVATQGAIKDSSNDVSMTCLPVNKSKLPVGCEDCKFVIEYKNTDVGFVSEWTSAEGVTFEYDCHRKAAVTYADRAAQKSDAITVTTGVDGPRTFLNSSNIKGLPSFRVCLKSQNKLVDQTKPYNTSGLNQSVVLRNVTLNLKFKKHGDKKYNGAIPDAKSLDTHQKINILVNSDKYDPSIIINGYKVNSTTDGAKNLVKEKDSEFCWSTAENPAYKVTPGDTGAKTGVTSFMGNSIEFAAFGVREQEGTLKNGTDTQEAYPDYSKLIKHSYDASDLSNLDKDNLNIVDLSTCLGENLSGKEDGVVAIIKFPNFKVGNKYATNAQIGHLFRYDGDEKEFLSSGKYGLNGIDKGTDRAAGIISGNKDNIQRIIPVNTNFALEISDNNTQCKVYRKTPYDYEDHIKLGVQSKAPLPELVTIRIDSTAPNSDGSITAYSAGVTTRYINIYVTPKNVKELKWGTSDDSDFTFPVAEGDKMIDIGSILSAQLAGSTSGIKYYLRGVVDQSGILLIDASGVTDGRSLCDFSGCLKKQLKLVEDTDYIFTDKTTMQTKLGDGTEEQLNFKLDTTKSTVEVDPTSELAEVIAAQTELSTFAVNSKLNLYHTTAGATSPTTLSEFDAYTRKQWTLLVEAQYLDTAVTNVNATDSSCVEYCFQLVTINVNPPKTNFQFNSGNTNTATDAVVNKGACYAIQETQGLAGVPADVHNPKIMLSGALDEIHNTNLGTTKSIISGGKLVDSDESGVVTVKIVNLDSDLEVVHKNGNIYESWIQLKNTDSNKSTETPSNPINQGNAPFPHYNYERPHQKSQRGVTGYKFSIEVCLRTNCELVARKVPTDYICGIGSASTIDPAEKALIDAGKTCTWLIDLSDADNSGLCDDTQTLNEDRTYYFKNPETGKYEGPFSTSPYKMSQVTSSKSLEGISAVLKNAYIRVVSANETYTPLYKCPEFKEDELQPKPEDCATIPFCIEVKNTFDSDTCNPLPYRLKEIDCYDYKNTDPADATKVELNLNPNKLHVIEKKDHICYVTTDHATLYGENGAGSRDWQDVIEGFKVPSWHPHSKDTTRSDVDPANRDMSTDLSMSSTKYKEKSLVTSSRPREGHAKNSIRFGKFLESDASDIVVLDYFIEFHDCIDPSGWNEIADDANSQALGEDIDYSGNTKCFKLNDMSNGAPTVEVVDSDKRMRRLGKICRDRKRSGGESDYYTTAELAFPPIVGAKAGEVYEFSIASVTNYQATMTDMSYNENMVCKDERFYPTIDKDHQNDAVLEKAPQPYQKYVYDRVQEAVVTLGYANSVDSNADGKTYTSRFGKILYVCRSHYRVCVIADPEE